MFDGFVSDGTVATEERLAETPVGDLRDIASGQSVLVAGTIDLPETAALGTFVPIIDFGGAYIAAPLCKVFVRPNIFTGYGKVAVAPELPVNSVTFFLGNNLAGKQVAVTPLLSPTPCEVAETKVLEEEYPEVFPV